MRRIILFAMVAAAGCFPEGECDSNQTLVTGLCIVLPPDAGPRVDATETDAGALDAASPASRFGVVCTDTVGCGGDTDLCALVPGSTQGFCTRSSCLPDPAICPSGWSCFDASAYISGYSLCVAS